MTHHSVLARLHIRTDHSACCMSDMIWSRLCCVPTKASVFRPVRTYYFADDTQMTVQEISVLTRQRRASHLSSATQPHITFYDKSKPTLISKNKTELFSSVAST